MPVSEDLYLPKGARKQLKTNKDLAKKGHFKKWSVEENKQYVIFLNEMESLLHTETERRCNKVFTLMATYIPTRTSEQCRTHHQKMILACGSIKKIIEKLQAKIMVQSKPLIPKKRGRKPSDQKTQHRRQAVTEADISSQYNLSNEEIQVGIASIDQIQYENKEDEWMNVFTF